MGRGGKIVALATVLTALLFLLGVFKPIIDSGPLPVSSRAEVDGLRKDLTGTTDQLKKGLDDTLATAKAASIQAQQAVQLSNSNRLDRLLQQKVQLEAQIKMSPNDSTLKLLLAKTELDIGALANAPSSPGE